MTRDDLLAAAGPSVDAGRWLETFDELMTRAGARFSRVESRRRARAFVLGLLAELPRKNCSDRRACRGPGSGRDAVFHYPERAVQTPSRIPARIPSACRHPRGAFGARCPFVRSDSRDPVHDTMR